MHKPPKPLPSVSADPDTPPVGLALMLLEVLALCGYGLWLLLGLALGLGIYSGGRGDALVPLTLGCFFVSAGLLTACLRLPVMPEWHGWPIGRGHRPTREALLALATYLPMFGLAGLVRGNDAFWATRLIGMVLMVCSLACLIISANGYRTRRLAQAGVTMQIPLSRVLSACYGGGLWLWVCAIFQADLLDAGAVRWPWVIGLLLLALLLGLADGLGWQQSLRYPTPGERRRHAQDLQSRRFLAAALICAVPCISLLLAPVTAWGRWLALCAALAYVAGKTMELRLYDVAFTRSAESESSWPQNTP
jgi:sulfite dehydrogenase (quinone) subunit SoeC